MLLLSLACNGSSGDTAEPFVFLEPADAVPALRGSGGPAASFDDDELFETCAFLDGNDKDWDHHNLVMPYRGHLVMPWAAEWGTGGLSFWEMSDPCSPVKVGETWEQYMRETHAVGFLHLPEDDPQAGDYAIVNGNLGIQVWDVSDETAPEMLTYLELPDVIYPDAYARVVLAVSWQHPWLFVAAADNGIFVLDTSTVAEPELVTQYAFPSGLRAGGVFALGNRLLVTSAEQTQAAMVDISDPEHPELFAGGLFDTADGEGQAMETYHGNLSGPYALFARKEGGGGAIVYDVSDPAAPAYVNDVLVEGGNGGYVFYDEGVVFIGESHWADVYDMSDMQAPEHLGRGVLTGDLDTITPYGNVAILSVDDDAEDDQASAVMPWSTTPDVAGPQVMLTDPADGETGVPVTSRIGLGMNEVVEPSSAVAGSLRLWDEAGEPVHGWGSAQENQAHYSPSEALLPGTTYTVEAVAGGLADLNGNTLAETVSWSFTTAD